MAILRRRLIKSSIDFGMRAFVEHLIQIVAYFWLGAVLWTQDSKRSRRAGGHDRAWRSRGQLFQFFVSTQAKQFEITAAQSDRT